MAKKRSSRLVKAKSAGKSPKRKAAARRAPNPSTEDIVVIYVHGISPHPPEDIWKREWDLALFGKPMGAERTRSAYWSDVLHGKTTAKTWVSQASRTPAFSDTAALLKLPGIPRSKSRRWAEARQFVEAMVDRFDLETGRPPAGKYRGSVLPLPRGWRSPVAQRLMRWFVRDAAEYFFDDSSRRKINNRLIRQIQRVSRPFVLVTHSLGTVIAYEVLSELKPRDRAEVSLLVTLGSPLGITEVQDQIRKRVPVLAVPPGVLAWDNFTDRFDLVAADPTLADDFSGNEACDVEDRLIANQKFGLFKGWNPHHSGGYLSHPEVRNSVYRAAREDLTARFLVARDVAERFASTERQPVLIEVLEPGYRALGEESPAMEKRESQQYATSRKTGCDLSTLTGRVTTLAEEVRKIVGEFSSGSDRAAEKARVIELRKYVSANLQPIEIQELVHRHAELNVYRVWRSSPKRILINRSPAVLGVNAAANSYQALGHNVVWAVLDTGCRSDHPHFVNADRPPTIIDVLDCTTSDSRPVSISNVRRQDEHGHGSHVAGIIAGEGVMGDRKYASMAPRARLLVYKVLNKRGEGDDSWIIKALDDIYRRNSNASGLKVHGVNLSLGGPFDTTVFGCGFSPICMELRDLWRQGVVVCTAAGNEGTIEVETTDGAFDLNTSLSIGDPANLEDSIAVGSVHSDKPYLYGISRFSSRGPTTDGRLKPDVVAPGERIFSCNFAYSATGKRSRLDPYIPESGTSMACPHVSGLIAAFLSVRQEFMGRPDDVKRILLENCNDLRRDRYHQGAGVPNLVKMLVNT